MTQFETRGGRLLLFEPERLDAWIGRRIEKDHFDLATGKPLSKKDATSFEAYHARRLRRSRLGDKVDRYIHLVDKYVPKVSDEARVYIARFPHKVGEVLKQVRKIRKKIRKRRKKHGHQAVLQPTSSLPTTPGGAAAQTVPEGEPAGELVTKERGDTLGHDDGEQLDDTPPDWGGSSTEEGAQQPDTSAPSWPWGEAGRPSDRGESTGVLAEKPREPMGDPLPKRRSFSRSPDGSPGGVQLTPNATWQGVQLVQAHMAQSRARKERSNR